VTSAAIAGYGAGSSLSGADVEFMGVAPSASGHDMARRSGSGV